MKHLTIKSILSRTTKELAQVGIENFDLDARVLLEAAIDKKTAYIFSHPEAPMTNADYAKFRRYIRRRKKGEPIAYILGHKEFFGLDFYVNKNVLIPRPETELLVEEALDFIKQHKIVISSHRLREPVLDPIGDEKSSTLCSMPDKAVDFSSRSESRCRNDNFDHFRVLDVGTGSGCIIISLIRAIDKTTPLYPRTLTKEHSFGFYATDISSKALNVARKNAKKMLFKTEFRELLSKNGFRSRSNNVVAFFRSNLFLNPRLPKKFDLIIANLPYVPKDKKPAPNWTKKLGSGSGSVRYEPQNAIFADSHGTDIVKRFMSESKDRINNGGLILAELDPRNANVLYKYTVKQFPKAKIELKKDLTGRDRYLKIQL